MKTVTSYESIPLIAAYIGSEDGGGWLDESTADLIDSSIEPIRYRDEDGIHHYFELQL